MEDERWKVFLDTSALIAGIVSATGAAREALRLCEAGVVEPLVSRQVLTEADRNLSAKLPALVSGYRHLMRQMSPTLLEDPTRAEVARAAQIIHRKDAPILAAAISGEADYLITWNTRHFHAPSVMRVVRFRIVTPGEFLEEFRRLLSANA
ncbi:MAG: PIN domain nuclease [Candidatus Methylomirabilota bacterium]|nr:PIN domain-containing protein [Candidatus Methylomirabilis sp.]NJD68223.1 PIN domain-containing protein [candidate division NC10 bacterium]PWB46178.1 MAG: PIN domain nuclease [candidate division NC10 bacterium]